MESYSTSGYFSFANPDDPLVPEIAHVYKSDRYDVLCSMNEFCGGGNDNIVWRMMNGHYLFDSFGGTFDGG